MMTVIKEPIFIEALKREAMLHMLIPDAMLLNQKAYPVLYMHDGQNLFEDESASFGVSWGIKTYFETLEDVPCMVVGISCAHGMDRLDEYTPWVNDTLYKENSIITRSVGGKGDVYLDFLVNTLKPMIDSRYPTRKDTTLLMGSSMGGLISLVGALRYPSIFKRVGCLSNAFFVTYEPLVEAVKAHDFSQAEKVYLDIGTQEVSGSVDSMEKYLSTNQEIADILKSKLESTRLKFEIIEGAIHHESAWKERFPSILSFLLADRSDL